MSKFQLSSGKKQEPDFFCLFGVEGIGKTTFAASFPAPVILDIEGGSGQIDVMRIEEDQLTSIQATVDAIKFVTDEESIQTIIVDSLSRLEKMIWAQVAKDHKKESIEDIGYAKGYIFALTYWEQILSAAKAAKKKGKNVILIAHNFQKTFQDPSLIEGYSRYEIELHHKAASLIKKNVDAIYFANYKTLVKDGRGFDTGERYLFTERRAAHDAKNRFGLPYEVKLDYASYIEAKSGSVISVESLRSEISGMLKMVPEEIREKIELALDADLSISELKAYLGRVEIIIGEKEE